MITIKTITPADVTFPRGRYQARCLDCAWTTTTRSMFQGPAEMAARSHVIRQGHSVAIDDHSNAPAETPAGA